jgi:hypothetical protein
MQSVGVILGAKLKPRNPNSELIVYVQTQMKLLEVLLTDSGLVIITIGNVPTGQFTIPIVETGIKERELPKHMGITLSSENTEGVCA